MILDLHTHIWLSLDQLGREIADRMRAGLVERLHRLDASPAAHERAMGCVDGAVILGFRSDRLDARIPNEYIAEFVARDPRRRIGIAGIDPIAADALEQLDSAISLGLSGVAVSPACQGFHPAHSLAMRIYERCQAMSMPLFVTASPDPNGFTPTSELEFARPALWDEVARGFPDLPIVIAQLGQPWIDETITLLGKHANVWSEISGVASRPWQLFNALLTASSLGVMGKLMFGSGFPNETPAKAIESLYSINTLSHGTQLPAIPRSQIRGIVERDAITCLGLDTIIQSREAATANGSSDPIQSPSVISRRNTGTDAAS